MGHDVSTHKSNYRLHANAIEITKVGKLLLAVDGADFDRRTVKNQKQATAGQ